MKAVKVASVTVVLVLVILVTILLSAHAEGKPPKPEPVLKYVVIEGDIWGGGAENGDPVSIPITFSSTFQGIGEDGLEHDESGAHVANPDNPPALEVAGVSVNRRLGYYYCTADSHDEEHLDEYGRCEPEASGHDPADYRYLAILDGKFDKKTGLTVFPKGSRWLIKAKIVLPNQPDGPWDGLLVAEGTLADDVTYREFYE